MLLPAALGFAPADKAKPFRLADFAPTADYRVTEYGLLSFNGQTRCPRWTLERLDEDSLTVNVKRDDSGFYTDKLIPKEFSPHPSDYLNTGKQRGHAANSANHRRSEEENHATFAMSNMMPQWPAVNTGTWKRLEDAIRGLAVDDTVVWVLTAPVWKPNASGRISFLTIGSSGVWVPTHCLKALLIDRSGRRECLAWLVANVENPNEAYDSYRITTDEAEAIAGLDLWAALDDDEEDRLERRR